MSLESCYDKMGGDLEGVRRRLRSDDRVTKFVSMFFHDETFSDLECAMDARTWSEAFRAAHTLKGLSRDLGFTSLYKTSDELTQVLRPAKEGNAVNEVRAKQVMDEVRSAYQLTIDALASIDG